MRPWIRAALVAASLCACSGTGEPGHRLIVLGIDGMDPELLRGFMQEGATPNLSRLAGSGGFMELGTSIPPQSPVAWSNLITGMDPGGHGIFDFLGFDRDSLLPYMSTARVIPREWEPLRIGRWRIPLDSEETQQRRDGRAFWELLEQAGVPTRMFRIPANYPPLETGGRALSGMGTPDLRGTPGTFTFVTDAPDQRARSVAGGEITRVALRGGAARTRIKGPANDLIEGRPAVTAVLEISVDPEHPVAEIKSGDARVLLNVGEWSDWVPLEFDLLADENGAYVPSALGLLKGLLTLPGMVRFYLQETTPHLRLYVSPVNIDPRDPVQTIATPPEYGTDLARDVGAFYTQEMPEDTKALSAHVLSPEEFLEQSQLVIDERRRLLRHELEAFLGEQQRGLFFFYVSSIDQQSHMLYRQMDAAHPFHEDDTSAELAEALRETYRQIDGMVGLVMDAIDPDTTLIVMSDHGFAPFRHQAHLNSWLEQNGYLVLRDPEKRESYEWLQGIDWARTRAFALGLNSLYLNVRGRERSGVVDPRERLELAREIAAKLGLWVDPQTGERVVTQAVVREDVYSGPHVDDAPDLIVGYGRGYRASWATTSGKIPAGLIEANDREWSGDHCMDSRSVPGVLLANRPLAAAQADLRDLTVTILAEFGVAPLPEMTGRSVF